MKKKLFQVKSSLELKMKKLTEKELSFIIGGCDKEWTTDDSGVSHMGHGMTLDELKYCGGAECLAAAAAGSSGSGSNAPTCDGTVTHCCFRDIVIQCH